MRKIISISAFLLFSSLTSFLIAQTWSSLGTGMPHPSLSLESFYKHSNGKLDIGVFQLGTSGVTQDTIWNWNGSAFDTVISPLPSGPISVNCAAEFNGSYYVGTDKKLWTWNGASWINPLTNPSISGTTSINCLQVYGSNLYLCYNAAKFQKYDGTTHVNADVQFSTGSQFSCMIQSNGNLYVGGKITFNSVAGYPVAMISGSTATVPFTNTLGFAGTMGVSCMEFYNNELYVGGFFSNGSLAKWNGAAWVIIPGFTSTSCAPNAIKAYHNKLYIAYCDTIFSTDGTNTPTVVGTVPSGSSSFSAMEVYNNRLYLGGAFSSVNGVTNTTNAAMFNDSIVGVTGIRASGTFLSLDKIYPNPFSNDFTVQVEAPSNLSITDAMGRVVYSAKIEKGSSNIGSNLAKGIYFVVLNGRVSSKMVKQ